MIGRVLASLVLGFVFGTTGLLLAPDLGRIAGPTLCGGELIPERGQGALRFSCVTRSGQVSPVAPEDVVLHTATICAALALLPVGLLFRRVEAGQRRRRQTMEEDHAAALPARAEVLQIGASGSFKRQVLMRAADLHLVLWVTPARGRPYEAAVTWLVEQEALGRVAVGEQLPVRVNPARPERVYPAETWAHLVGWREAEPGLPGRA